MSNTNHDGDLYPPPLYTSAQENTLAFLPYLTAPLSVAGSSLIMWAIWFDRRQLTSPYHRIILATSGLDLLNSLGMIILGPWVVPSHYEYGRSGMGNTQTCEAAGFMLNLMFGNMWYYMFLSLYFVMLIRWEWKERRIACCMEPFAHFFGLMGPIMVNIQAIAHNSINPLRVLPGWCWFIDYPPFCSHGESEVECIRGDEYRSFADSYSAGMVAFIWIVIILCMIAIVLKVRRIERNLRRYAVGEPSYARTRETARQALLYIAVFFGTFAPVTALHQLADNPEEPTQNSGAIFFLAFVVKIVTPLQGFFNAFVYFRRRFSDLVKDGKSLAFIKDVPLLGPWIVAFSESRRRPADSGARWTEATAQISGDVASRTQSRVAESCVSQPDIPEEDPTGTVGKVDPPETESNPPESS